MTTVSLTRRAQLPISPARLSSFTRWGIGTLGLALLIFFAAWLFHLTGDSRKFPVSEVEVLGTLDYTDRDELRELVVSQTRNGFYRLDIDKIRRDVMKLPWIAEAHVRRVWPDRLSIDAVEHEPTARWNDDGLISKRYELFKPPQLESNAVQRAEWLAYFARFPQLSGAIGRHEAVLSGYRTIQVYLSGFDVQVEALIEDDRRSQTLVLSNNVSVRLGTTDQEVRIRRFVSLYERMVAPLGARATTFDMRYTNGFAMTSAGNR